MSSHADPEAQRDESPLAKDNVFGLRLWSTRWTLTPEIPHVSLYTYSLTYHVRNHQVLITALTAVVRDVLPKT